MRHCFWNPMKTFLWKCLSVCMCVCGNQHSEISVLKRVLNNERNVIQWLIKNLYDQHQCCCTVECSDIRPGKERLTIVQTIHMYPVRDLVCIFSIPLIAKLVHLMDSCTNASIKNYLKLDFITFTTGPFKFKMWWMIAFKFWKT